MNIKATCPKNPKHNTFKTVAHVMQEWKVDSAGEFIGVTEDCLQVSHRPDIENIFP